MCPLNLQVAGRTSEHALGSNDVQGADLKIKRSFVHISSAAGSLFHNATGRLTTFAALD